MVSLLICGNLLMGLHDGCRNKYIIIKFWKNWKRVKLSTLKKVKHFTSYRYPSVYRSL